MNWHAKWIRSAKEMKDVAPIFAIDFKARENIKSAHLFVTAMGIYEAKINGQRVSHYVLAPGWTSYEYRLQYQTYDVREMLDENNRLEICVGKGWFRGILNGDVMKSRCDETIGLLAQLEIEYTNGSRDIYGSDESWYVSESSIRFSEIYNGEIYDACFVPEYTEQAEVFEGYQGMLVPQEGEEIVEHEILSAVQIISTPKGEIVVDFGQEITGYVEVTVQAKEGELVRISHGEVLDKHGNFYNENYREAEAIYTYKCKSGWQTHHAQLTFYGFRYIRVDEFPGGIANVKLDNFRAIAVYSDMKQTGYVNCSNAMLNQLFNNIIWGQKDNFLDVPTDCPQRDERLGWLGDAQVFVRAAALNFDVEKFFAKWLADIGLEQKEDGFVPKIVPDIRKDGDNSSGWGDAVTICPWEIYQAYGNSQILKNQFECMKKYVDYITAHTETENLWIGGFHYGDWLGLDAEPGSYTGKSRKEVIASAYYAHSTSLVVKAGHVLGIDVSDYEKLYQRIVTAFRMAFPTYHSFVVYPGDKKPYYGVRGHSQRSGAYDYELFYQLGRKQDGQAKAKELIQRVCRGFADYDPSVCLFDEIRHELLEILG